MLLQFQSSMRKSRELSRHLNIQSMMYLMYGLFDSEPIRSMLAGNVESQSLSYMWRAHHCSTENIPISFQLVDSPHVTITSFPLLLIMIINITALRSKGDM